MVRSRHKQREFASVEHLGPEAISAYVDGEMSLSARRRAHHHLCECEECRAQVTLHRRTAERVRSSGGALPIPDDLLSRLHGIAVECAPGPVAEDTPHCKPGLWERLDYVFHGDARRLDVYPHNVSETRSR